MRFPFPALIGLVLCSAIVQADNWPAWRGPSGQGYCEETNVPVKWNAKENVKWKVALEFPGNSTPIVWGDRIFVTQANKDAKGKGDPKKSKDGTIRSLLCLSRADGKKLWQKDVQYDISETNYAGITYCNASPVTDGQQVVACFGSAGLHCYDFNGKELWKRTDLGKWEHQFGNGSSPVIYGNLVIQWCGPNEAKDARNYLIAVNKTNGKTEWEHDESYGSWSTPVIAKVEGKDQLILGQSRDVKNQKENRFGFLKGIDPKTGAE
ncbi:MAG TPA: PQQ-binding-like beta-propeller repeat protein, partial [Gemmata sp.]|nr:PQQ-binding-like beta-propeller repeat protein [Gemmata sp.]